MMNIVDVEINSSGKGSRNKIGAVLRFHGVQKLNVSKVKIGESSGIDLYLTNGEPITTLSDVTFKNSAGLKANNNEYKSENIVITKE